MARNRQGDLRLLKDGVAFGPTDRAGLEQLVASGRVSLADYVSVSNADWIPISEYLAGPAVVPIEKPAPAQVPATPASRRKRGELRVINAGRIISSLHRDQVEQLRSAGRIGNDDLICASNGPWMRIADFFLPPLAEADPCSGSPVAEATEIARQPCVVDAELVEAPMEAVIVDDEELNPSPHSVAGSTPAVPVFSPPLNPLPVVPNHRLPAPAAGYRLAPVRPPAPPANDEWYVRVRGMYSASLRKHHVKALYQAREITLDNLARNGSWHDNDWRPIHSIPHLADIAQGSP